MMKSLYLATLLVLLAAIGTGDAITCYNCHYNDEGADNTNCASVTDDTPTVDCDTKGNRTTKLDACIETVSSRINDRFEINRGCTLMDDFHCTKGVAGEAIYCCQGADLCNSKDESELASGHVTRVAIVLLLAALCVHWL